MSINLKKSATQSFKNIGVIGTLVIGGAFVNAANAENPVNTGSSYSGGVSTSHTNENKKRDFSRFLPENHVAGKFVENLKEAQRWAKKGEGVAITLAIGHDVKDEQEAMSLARELFDKYSIPIKFFIEHRTGGSTKVDFSVKIPGEDDQTTFAGMRLDNFGDQFLKVGKAYVVNQKLEQAARDNQEFALK